MDKTMNESKQVEEVLEQCYLGLAQIQEIETKGNDAEMLYTMKETCQMLGITKSLLSKYLNTGIFGIPIIYGKLFVRQSTVDTLLKVRIKMKRIEREKNVKKN